MTVVLLRAIHLAAPERGMDGRCLTALTRGQFLKLLTTAAPCSSTGGKEKETAHSNLKISCCSHTRSIPLLPVPWRGVHSLCPSTAGPGQAGERQKQSARPCALLATPSETSALSSGSGMELNTAHRSLDFCSGKFWRYHCSSQFHIAVWSCSGCTDPS